MVCASARDVELALRRAARARALNKAGKFVKIYQQNYYINTKICRKIPGTSAMLDSIGLYDDVII